MTEATLHGSVVTLTLSGRRFTEYRWEIEDALTISGIDGVGVRQFDVKRVSDTVVTVELVFSGDFNSDATLTFTIGAGAMVGGYNGPALTAKIPVIAVEQSDATVSVSPSPILLPAIGEQLALSLNIANGKNVVGYQATVLFDGSTLDYVKSANGDYLPADALVGGTIIVDGWLGETFSEENAWKVILLATTFAGAANGDGTLATLTFEVLDYKASKVTLSQVYLVDSDGKRWEATTESGEVTELPEPAEKIFGDINRDSIVNIQDLMIISVRFGQRGQNSADLNGDGLVDIVDLVLAANAFGAEAAGPSLNPQILEQLTAADVKSWLTQARQLILTDPAYLRGITVLEQLLMALTPKTTALLPNFRTRSTLRHGYLINSQNRQK